MTTCKCAEYGQPWQEDDQLIDVCELYVGLEGDDETCMKCAHVRACHLVAEKQMDLDAIIHRLQEMEYAVEGGNSAREDVSADELKNWFRYVWTGDEAQQ